MKCPKCNSENVQIQAKEFKSKMVGASCLAFGGMGLAFLGIIGIIIGVVIGLIVGIILDGISANKYQSVMVCQDCGYVSQPMTKTNASTVSHPLFCKPEESNLEIVRNDLDKGTIIAIQIKVDNSTPFRIMDNTTLNLKVPDGMHTISYEQLNGIGRKNNHGHLNVEVDEKKTISLSFTRQGLIVK